MRKLQLLWTSIYCFLFFTLSSPALAVYATSAGEHEARANIKITDKKDVSMYIDFTYPQIEGLADQTLQKKINEMIKARVYELQKKDVFDEVKKYFWTRYQVTYLKDSILSIRLDQSVNAERAAHPANFISAITLDLQSGKEYRFADLFKPGTPYVEKVNELARKEIGKLDFGLLKPFEGVTKNQEFYLTPHHLVVFFQEGEYTPHVYGPLVIQIPLAELKPVLNWIALSR